MSVSLQVPSRLLARFALSWGCVLFAGGAAVPNAPVPPAAATALEPLSFFAGQWDCAGEFTASQKPIAAHVAAVADLEGAWLSFRWDDKAPGPFHALEMWGFDKTAKRFTNLIFDNFGGVRRFSSPGWEGSSLVWTLEAAGSPPAAEERFVFERQAGRQFVVSWQVRKPSADWKTGDRLTCRG